MRWMSRNKRGKKNERIKPIALIMHNIRKKKTEMLMVGSMTSRGRKHLETSYNGDIDRYGVLHQLRFVPWPTIECVFEKHFPSNRFPSTRQKIKGNIHWITPAINSSSLWPCLMFLSSISSFFPPQIDNNFTRIINRVHIYLFEETFIEDLKACMASSHIGIAIIIIVVTYNLLTASNQSLWNWPSIFNVKKSNVFLRSLTYLSDNKFK